MAHSSPVSTPPEWRRHIGSQVEDQATGERGRLTSVLVYTAWQGSRRVSQHEAFFYPPGGPERVTGLSNIRLIGDDE